MVQTNFAYATPANDGAGLPVALSIFADRAHICGQFRDDLEAAGFRIARAGPLADLLDDEARPLGEVVMLDCPEVDGARLAALMRLDMRVANCARNWWSRPASMRWTTCLPALTSPCRRFSSIRPVPNG